MYILKYKAGGEEMIKPDTKQIFADALVELCKTKPLEKITVQNIVDYCEAGRQTFYNHFKDKEDLIGFVFMNDERKCIENLQKGHTLKEQMKLIFGTFVEKKQFYVSAYITHGQNSLGDIIFEHYFDYYTKLIAEKEGIFLWCLEGLHRLISNGFQFTISEQANRNMDDVMKESNSIIEFLSSEGYVRFKADCEASTSDLYSVYKIWCNENAATPLSSRSFASYLKQNLQTYNLEYTNKVHLKSGRYARGFVGIEIEYPCFCSML